MLLLDKHVYICTLTSLRDNDMLKIDVSPGEYKLTPFNRGYVFTRDPNFAQSEIVHMFRTREGDKGLTGTYWNGDSKDPEQIRIFKDGLCKRFDQYFKSPNGLYCDALILEENFDETIRSADNYNDSFDSDNKDSCYNSNESDNEEPMLVPVIEVKPSQNHAPNKCDIEVSQNNAPNKCDICYPKPPETPEKNFPKYYDDKNEVCREIKNVIGFNVNHNLPFIFFLNKQISHYDLVELEETETIENCGFLHKVLEGEEHIGYVVEKHLHIMTGDQVGLGLYNNAVAFGNFCVDAMPNYLYNENQDQYEKRPPWCSFENCQCDIKHEYHLKKMVEIKKKWMVEKKSSE